MRFFFFGIRFQVSQALTFLGLAADDYSAFSQVWDQPDGGIHGYLVRFLESQDTTFQHIAIWTLVQLLESDGSSCRLPLR